MKYSGNISETLTNKRGTQNLDFQGFLNSRKSEYFF